MTNMDSPTNPDLESFRQQWKAEVTQKKVQNQAATRQTSQPSTSAAAKATKRAPRRPSAVVHETGPLSDLVKDGYYDEAEFSEEEETKASKHEKNKSKTGPLSTWKDGDMREEDGVEKEPVSALDHYEKAVERETQGQLGESLKLYQKAFKMDDQVDKKYKNKHFPPSAPKPPKKATTSTNARPSKDATNTAHHSSEAATTATEPAIVLPYPELIQSFVTLPIPRAQPLMEEDPLPPCPISELPEEILLHIMTDLAISDFQSFIKLARVCKRFAYLVATEDSIWKRICIGPEIGYGGMIYEWKCDVDGSPLEDDISDELAGLAIATPPRTLTPAPPNSQQQSTTTPAPSDVTAIAVPTLLPPALPTFELTEEYPTYAKMLRFRPRIRYNGIYISTCNYIRPGAVEPSRTWGAAVHMVTYYRYLRFFRDGRCLSLLSTHEPKDIVPIFTPDLLDKPTVVVKAPGRQGRQRRDRTVISEAKENPIENTYKGRWKLGAEPASDSEGSGELDESALSVETEGVYEKYTYRMDFIIKGQERGRSRLQWDGFHAYNKEEDQWVEISRKNEKVFIFSRVRAYGMGG